MLHRTSIGLDVHARSIAAAAFIPETGEVLQKSFGVSGLTLTGFFAGFDLKRKLDESGVECLVGAVSKVILGVLSVSVATPASVVVASGSVTVVGASALAIAHAGVFVFFFVRVNSVFGKQIAQLPHAHGGAFFG